ncbi:hypothetical protein PVNG_02421 [Plasmodium vivax North Korean]|uniref:DNA-directed RNA polymerase n=1 Tax=Plasmodium vivax North Korean TaxID=1035514 RepID=A0A0J9W6R5_PLAVI|nr:hypothetical protein PVNG_02421 [Plasmodium vivax North Korean]
MQRQAVPLLAPKSPIVATGAESRIARDSGMVIFAEDDGVITYRDSSKIKVQYHSKKLGEKTYFLRKFNRSNQNTCRNQVLLPRDSKNVSKGEVMEFSVECKRTKIGDEEVTRFIPGCTSEQKRYLDEDGVVLVGAYVREGDILVGKTSPKTTGEVSAEERLLQAIFAEKAKSVKDTSLRLPSGAEGVVTKVLRYSMAKGDRLGDDVIESISIFVTSKRNIQIGDKMVGRHGNKGIVSKVVPVEDMPYMEDGTPVDILLNPLGVPSRMNIGQILESCLAFSARKMVFYKILESYFGGGLETLSTLLSRSESELSSLSKVLESYLRERKITSLDEAKSKLTQLDFTIILSKSGFRYDELDIKVLTPIFAGCKHTELVEMMKASGIDNSSHNGRFVLFDGKTGERFKDPISVGVIYMLKLDHMVDDKIYARSVGPYSKITQQPLGGKCQNGGQRFGEMEV